MFLSVKKLISYIKYPFFSCHKSTTWHLQRQWDLAHAFKVNDLAHAYKVNDLSHDYKVNDLAHTYRVHDLAHAYNITDLVYAYILTSSSKNSAEIELVSVIEAGNHKSYKQPKRSKMKRKRKVNSGRSSLRFRGYCHQRLFAPYR